MAKKLTKRQLVAAYKELDKVIGVDPPIDYEDLSVEEFARELLETVEELVEPGDKFSDSTQAIFDQLKEEPEEPEDDPEEKEEPDDEPEEDDKEEDDPEEKEEPDDEPEEDDKENEKFKREGSFAAFVDDLMEEGGTWEEILEKAKPEAEKRNTKSLSSIGALKAHVKYRNSKGKNWKSSDKGVNL
jgi:outer membrane biosynthesis protein TonB